MTDNSIVNEHFGGYSVVRADYLLITGDACAAQILHSLEHWTAHRFYEIEKVEQQNAEALKSGVPQTPVPSVWLYEKIQNFVDAICGTFKRNKVIEALKLLKSKGFIESKPSPIPRDQTLLYKFNIDEVEEALRKAKTDFTKSKKKVKSESLNSNPQSLDLNPSQSLDLNRQSSDLNSVQSPDSNPDPLYNSRSNIQDQNSISPPTPQGGTREFSDSENLLEEEDPGQEQAIDCPSEPKSKQPSCQKQIPLERIGVPGAAENDSRFLPTDTTTENMKTWTAIAATGAMRGERQPNPEFLEFYRQTLSKTTYYKNRDCNLNHAKAALSKLWKNEPDRILAEAESWAKSKLKPSTSTRTRDAMSIPREERLALARAIQERKKAQQQAKGA